MILLRTIECLAKNMASVPDCSPAIRMVKVNQPITGLLMLQLLLLILLDVKHSPSAVSVSDAHVITDSPIIALLVASDQSVTGSGVPRTVERR